MTYTAHIRKNSTGETRAYVMQDWGTTVATAIVIYALREQQDVSRQRTRMHAAMKRTR